LFWKKKNSDDVSIQLDDDDRRASVRIQPIDKIVIQYEGQQFEVLDISATGLSFKSDTLKNCENLNITLFLPTLPGLTSNTIITINCTIQILRTSNTIFHCQFAPLASKAQEQLDLFILTEQKRQIREKALQTALQKKMKK